MIHGGKPPGTPQLDVTRRSLLIGAGGVAVSGAAAKARVVRGKSHVVVVGAGAFGGWTALELRRRGGGVGVASLCGGGGQGDALVVRVPKA
jgi:hypothetical protein